MNDELKDALLHWLNKIEKAVDSGGEFILDQAPITVQQWVNFTIVESLIQCLGCIAGFMIFSFLFCKCWGIFNKLVKEPGDNEMFPGMAMAACGFFNFMLFIGFCTCLHRGLLAYLAPNVFIIKELQNLIK